MVVNGGANRGVPVRIPASVARIPAARSSETSPINFSVMCAPSMRTQRAARLSGSRRARSATSESRTSGGMSRATKRRKRSILAGLAPSRVAGNVARDFRARHGGFRLAQVEEVAADHVERRLRSLPADAVAVTGRKLRAARLHSGDVGQRDVDEADRFFRRAAAGPGDARDTDSE